MLNVEQAIREVGAVYQALTGRAIEPGRSELPSEVDPLTHIEGRYRHFKSMIESPGKVSATPAPVPAWSPATDVIELEREVRCQLDLPGVPRDQVSVSVAGDHLVVRGRRDNALPPSAALRHAERHAGQFQRIIALPPRARRDAIEAVLQDGVLTIVILTDGDATEGVTTTIDVK